MKKIIVTLAVLLLAAPVMATVTITCTETDVNEVTVSFTSDEGARLVRAFALDVQINDPNVWIEDINCVHAGYNISPTNVDISPQGEMSEPESDDCAAIHDHNMMISEQASLYTVEAPEPGVLFILTLGGCAEEDDGGTASVVVTVSENALRGKIVMEDIGAPTEVISDGVTVTMDECVPPCPCMGDVDESTTVNFSDLMLIYTEMIDQYPDGDDTYIYEIGNPEGLPCGDVDDSGSINFTDLMIIYTEMIDQYPDGDDTYVYEIGCPF